MRNVIPIKFDKSFAKRAIKTSFENFAWLYDCSKMAQ